METLLHPVSSLTFAFLLSVPSCLDSDSYQLSLHSSFSIFFLFQTFVFCLLFSCSSCSFFSSVSFCIASPLFLVGIFCQPPGYLFLEQEEREQSSWLLLWRRWSLLISSPH